MGWSCEAPSLICPLPASPASLPLFPVTHPGEELPAIPRVSVPLPILKLLSSVLFMERLSPAHFPAPQHALAAPESFPSLNAELKLSFFSGSFLIIPGE